MAKLTIDTTKESGEFFDTIVAWSLKESYETLCMNIRDRPNLGIWCKDPKKDMKIAKRLKRSLETVMDYYGVRYAPNS